MSQRIPKFGAVWRNSRGRDHVLVDTAPLDRIRLVWATVVLLVLAWAIELGSRLGADFGIFPNSIRDTIGFLSLLLVMVAGLNVLMRIPQLPRLVSVTIGLSIFCAFLFQMGDLLDEFRSLQQVVAIGKDDWFHQASEQFLAVSGALLLLAGFLFALLELESLRRRLSRDRELLGQQVEQREKSERALCEARGRLEAEVANRTNELAQRNAQLRVELQERVETEASLARRLQFEEGLATCSQILQTEPDAQLALKRCVAQLRACVGATRAFLYLNAREDPVAELAALTCAGGAAPAPRVTPRRWRHDTLPASWLDRFQRGEPVILEKDTLPPGWEGEGGDAVRLFLAIGWEGNWRGLLGFERTGAGAAWTREETRLLRTATEMLGAYKERQCAGEALRRAHLELEQRVAARTADLSATNERLQRAIADGTRAEAEKQQLERQLRQVQKMKAIGTLAGGIAHDFNNILSSILGFTELALLKLPDDLPQRRYLDEVYKAGNRAKELVRQILVFSRQSGEDRSAVDVHAIVSEAVALLEASLPDSVTLRARLDEGSGAVLADPVQMHQVVMNLCHNAIHAMEENGGTLEIHLRGEQFETPWRTPQGEIAAGSYAVLTVSDTGHGMAPSVAERIFEPFFTTKKVGEGTGMGLAIVHGIVSALDGAIAVETAPGAGASFHLYLPRHRQTRVPEPGEAMRPPEGPGHGHILVVDDEVQLVCMWEEMLRNHGYAVTSFTRSREALHAFESGPGQYDLALLDHTMPGLTGAELARAMLALRPDFPIIMATGFSESITADEAREMGIREFVLKPIITNELIATIQDMLRTVTPPA